MDAPRAVAWREVHGHVVRGPVMRLEGVADALGENTVMTFDGHFRAYRLPNRRALHLLPGRAG